MQSFKQIKTRIRGIENAQKVTAAMQMVSVTKLNRANNMLFSHRFYFSKLESMLKNAVTSYDGLLSSPFCKKRSAGNIALCIVTSDNGLCGTYNNNIIRLSEKFIHEKQGRAVKLIITGRRGLSYFRNRSAPVIASYPALNIKYSEAMAKEVFEHLIKIFLSNEADEIYVAYTHFKGALSFRPEIVKFLNLEIARGERVNYIYEPQPERILQELIQEYIRARFKLMLLEAATSEYAARAIAMKGATENAKELLRDLVLLRNKVRQTNITKDIIEIISSAESLRRE